MSEKWRLMSVEERATFVNDVEAKIDAASAELTPSTLINEKNSEVRMQIA